MMALVTFLYELGKETANPDITKWESHSVTIGFLAMVSFVAGYVVFGQHSRKNAELNRHRASLEDVVKQRTAKLNQANKDLQNEIAERIAMENRMIQSQKMEALGTLAGGIAHDFNNILAAILGNTELLLRLERATPTQELLEDISTSCTRAANLVRQIMTFSRMEMTSLVVVDLSQLVEESLRMVRATIPANISITKTMCSDSLMVRADATQMQQIILNLCTNGYQAMKANGGILEVGIERVRAALGVVPEQTTECVRLTISDTGSGIEAHILARIFDPFFTTKRSQEGTGLGLAVVHGLVENHGGTITVESEVDSGTTFTVLLPWVDDVPTEAEIAPSPLSPGKGHILVVEDEPQLRSIYARLLEEQGYSCRLCDNGEDALGVFRESPESYDLVLTDHAMPGMTGKQLIPEMRKLNPHLPIILATGYDMSDIVEGAEHYKQLVKPLESHLLLTSIAELLNS